jgi:UDPglucose--hexose-1-phosphate uridylyltransferase
VIEFRRSVLESEILDPERGFEPRALRVEVREDPLTGQTARLLPPAGLMPPQDADELRALGERTRAGCPFCPEQIEAVTPKLPAEITADGRIRRGEALLFPNLLPYARFSSVSVYSPERHVLTLDELTPRLVADNLAAQVAWACACVEADPSAAWVSINANHMLPSGSSIFHPHLQGAVNPMPTTMQRLLSEVPPARFRDYLAQERAEGARYLGGRDRVEWLASFAPLGSCELRAFVQGIASPTSLDAETVEELGAGIATAAGLYAELGYGSFNLALYGAPPGSDGYPLNLRMICRSSLAAFYRSDATWLERLHWEAAVDTSPEELAQAAGDRFTKPG